MNYLFILIIIGLLILIHEVGHFIAARLTGIPVERFSIGFGPALLKYRGKKTEYVLSLIPMGGYILPYIKDEGDFYRIPVSKRIIFSLGGVVANIIIAIFLLSILNTVKEGFSFQETFIAPFVQTWGLFVSFVAALAHLFTSPDNISGVVGIIAQGSSFIGTDLLKGLQFGVLLSLNLAVINLFPIPALDGGKVIMYMLEKIHPRLLKLQLPLSIAGWLFIIGLMIYATVLDIGRLV